jgi:hypothetical protein
MCVGLILAFPVLMAAAASSAVSGEAARGVRGFAPVVAVEAMMIGGLVFAGRERRRLLAEMDAVRTQPRRITSLAGPKLALKPFFFSLIKR